MSPHVVHENDFELNELVGRSYKLIVGSDKLPCDAINGGISFFPPLTHAPGHIHDVAEEVIYCLEGQGEVVVDGRSEMICPGSFVVIPARLLHSINNTGVVTIKLLYLFSPKIQVGRYPNISSDQIGFAGRAAMKIDETQIESLKRTACELRRELLKMIHAAKSGHPGGALSAADIITALYWKVMRIRPGEPDWPDRDRFILSKGHVCPVLYTALCLKGYFGKEHLTRLRQINGILQGHPDMKKTPGVDSTSGSLGNGLSVGIGMSLMGKLDKKQYRTFVMLGCGEMDEGLIWEAALCANKYKLDNLCAIVDYNRLQLDGTNDEIMPLEPLGDKWQAFGWNVLKIDGHNMEAILDAFDCAEKTSNRPTVIIADTIKGKGISYMENVCGWHGRAPDDQELKIALKELEEVDN